MSPSISSTNQCYDMSASHRSSSTSRHRPRRRWLKVGVWIVVVLFVVWVAASVRWFGFPPALSQPGKVGPVDAVYVLGVATKERLAAGIELVESDTSDHLVVTVTPGNSLDQFCATEHPFTVDCVTPDPVSTGGEAQQWATLAEQHQLDSVAIVTMRSHATRAVLYFERCFSGDVRVVDDQVLTLSWWQWIEQSIYETGAMIKFVASKDC